MDNPNQDKNAIVVYTDITLADAQKSLDAEKNKKAPDAKKLKDLENQVTMIKAGGTKHRKDALIDVENQKLDFSVVTYDKQQDAHLNVSLRNGSETVSHVYANVGIGSLIIEQAGVAKPFLLTNLALAKLIDSGMRAATSDKVLTQAEAKALRNAQLLLADGVKDMRLTAVETQNIFQAYQAFEKQAKTAVFI